MDKNDENVKVVVSVGSITVNATDETKTTDEEKKMVDVDFKGVTITYHNADRAFLGGLEKTWGAIPNQISAMIEQGKAQNASAQTK